MKKHHRLKKRQKNALIAAKHCNSKNDLQGKRFGLLTAIEIHGSDGCHTYWKCRCECGKITSPSRNSLLRGMTKSCGCRVALVASSQQKKHGMAKHPAYKVYYAIRGRCRNKTNSGYPGYGKRGIFLSKEWTTFEGFWKDMGARWKKGLCIDRIDNNGPYSKLNCRWITNLVNQQNKRTSKFLTYKNETKTIADWARKFDIKDSVFRSRLKLGWTVDEAIKG